MQLLADIVMRPDTATLVKQLQDDVVKLSWARTLDKVQIQFLFCAILFLLSSVVMLYFYMRRKRKQEVQKERRLRIFQEAHYRLAQMHEEGNQKKVRNMEVQRLFHCARTEELKVTEQDWAALQRFVSDSWPQFIPALQMKAPKITQIELRICMLIKISVSVTDIAYLVNRTKQAITVSRSRLYKKITGEEGTAEQLDKLMIDLETL